jgi:hypothetical protein
VRASDGRRELAKESRDRKQFEKDSSGFVERATQQYIATSPENRLPAFDGQTIFDELLVGFVDGDDPIFLEYKKTISNRKY